jgi:hypothetical protein
MPPAPFVGIALEIVGAPLFIWWQGKVNRAAVEADEVPDASILEELQAGLRALTPAMHEEVRLAKAGTASKATVEALTLTLRPQKEETEIEKSGSWEFTSSRNATET